MMDGLQGLFTGLVISNILYLSFVYTFAHRHGFRFKVEVLCTFGAVVIVLVSGMLRYNWLSIISVLILLFSFRVRLNSYVQKVLSQVVCSQSLNNLCCFIEIKKSTSSVGTMTMKKY